MGVLSQAAVVVNLLRTGLTMGVLVQSARQVSFLVQTGAVMGVLSQATIVLSLLRTGFAMGVFLQATSQVAIFIQAKFTMEVFCFITEIHDFLCRSCAFGRFCFRMLALRTMGMLIHAAGQFPGAVAEGRVVMILTFFFSAGQGVCIRRHFRHFIARIRMNMLRLFFPAADQIAVFIIAFRRMLVKIRRIDGADQLLFLYCFHLGIAVLRMNMLRYSALFFSQCNGRKYQRVRRAEHHNRRQAGHCFQPAFLSPMYFCILCGLMPYIRCHMQSPLFSSNFSLRVSFIYFIYFIYFSVPSFVSGHTRNTILPTTCSSATQPTAVFLESTEVDR